MRQLSYLAPGYLQRIRWFTMWLGAGLAIAVLSLVTSAYEGLQTEFRSLLSGDNAETLAAYFVPNSGRGEQFQALRPEGLTLFRIPSLHAYFVESKEPIGEGPFVTQEDAGAIRALPSVAAVAWQLQEPEFGASPDRNFRVLRVSSSYFQVRHLPLAQGRLPTVEDGPDAVVIGAEVADYLLPDRNPLGAIIESHPDATPFFGRPPAAYRGSFVQTERTQPYRLTVVGVLAPVAETRPLPERDLGAAIFRVSETLDGQTRGLWVQAQPGQTAAAMADVRALLGPRAKQFWPLIVESTRDEHRTQILGEFQQLVTRSFAWIIGLAVALAVIAVGVSCYLGVLLRAREIGIRRSLGATQRHVLRRFIAEGVTIGGISLVVGLGLAWLSRPIAQAAGETTPVFGPLTLGGAALLALVIGLLANTVPVRPVIQQSPVQALRERTGSQLHRRRWLWGGLGITLSLLGLIFTLGLRDGLAARMDQILSGTGERTVNFT